MPNPKKHSRLDRPDIGTFHRHELAILGAPCSEIQALAHRVGRVLSSRYKLGYVDADHHHADQEETTGRDPKSWLAHGGTMEFTDKITFSRTDEEGSTTEFAHRVRFSTQDLVLVNGNHFRARQQVVMLDPRKSLEKKLDRLTDVRLLLSTDHVTLLPDYLVQHLGDAWERIPMMHISETQKIADFIEKEIIGTPPPVYGLVLAGGRSERMQRDKGQLDYHGQPQREYLHEFLQPFCEKVFVSCRPEQQEELAPLPLLPDSFTRLGPMGAILSAFRAHPNAAWLVVACDLPYLDAPTVQFLLDHRNPSATATAFRGYENFPEPLIALWEPRAYLQALQFLGLGYSCPRKVLINTDCNLLEAPRPEALQNVNHPHEYEAAVQALRND